MNMAEFDAAVAGLEAHVGGDAARLVPPIIDDGIKLRVATASHPVHPAAQRLGRVERSVGRVGPAAAVGIVRIGLEQVGNMRLVQQLQAAIGADHRRAGGRRHRLPVR